MLFNCLKHHAGYVAGFISNYPAPGLTSAGHPEKENNTGKDTSHPGQADHESLTGLRGHTGLSEAGKKLQQQLTATGKSQTDFYTGRLTPLKIAREIKSFLEGKKLLEKASYLQWLDRPGSLYRITEISDGSVWVLLPGKTEGRHVHIHPARYSPLTLRIRSETLKTAIAVLWYCNLCGRDHNDLKVVNEAREKLLGLSPVREVKAQRGIGKIIRILTQMALSK